MSENASTNEEEGKQTNELSHKRIFLWLCLIVLIGSCISAVIMPLKFATGFLLGGLGSVLNYYWLKWSFSAMFAKAIKGEKKRFLAARFVFRYCVLGAVLAIVYLTGFVPVTAVIFGLASFALAVVVEGIFSIFVRDEN